MQPELQLAQVTPSRAAETVRAAEPLRVSLHPHGPRLAERLEAPEGVSRSALGLQAVREFIPSESI